MANVSAVVLTAEMRARQGARVFSQGVYLDIHDQENVKRNAVSRSIAAVKKNESCIKCDW